MTVTSSAILSIRRSIYTQALLPMD